MFIYTLQFLASDWKWLTLGTFSTKRKAIERLRWLKKQNREEYRIIAYKSYSGMFLEEYIVDNNLNERMV